MKQVELALSSKQASHLAHRELAVVRDLSRIQFPNPTTWHNKGELGVTCGDCAFLKLYVGTDRVTDKCSEH